MYGPIKNGDSLASHVSFQDLGFYNLITLLTTGDGAHLVGNPTQDAGSSPPGWHCILLGRTFQYVPLVFQPSSPNHTQQVWGETWVLEVTILKQPRSEDRPQVFVSPLKGVHAYNWKTGLSATTLPETNSESKPLKISKGPQKNSNSSSNRPISGANLLLGLGSAPFTMQPQETHWMDLGKHNKALPAMWKSQLSTKLLGLTLSNSPGVLNHWNFQQKYHLVN